MLAVADRLLDALEVEDDDPSPLLGHHLGEGDAFFGVVAGRPRVLALVVGVDVVEVAVNDDLPGDLHGLAVHGVNIEYFFGSSSTLPSFGSGTRSSPLQNT